MTKRLGDYRPAQEPLSAGSTVFESPNHPLVFCLLRGRAILPSFRPGIKIEWRGQPAYDFIDWGQCYRNPLMS
jgi:hypothetical protein